MAATLLQSCNIVAELQHCCRAATLLQNFSIPISLVILHWKLKRELNFVACRMISTASSSTLSAMVQGEKENSLGSQLSL